MSIFGSSFFPTQVPDVVQLSMQVLQLNAAMSHSSSCAEVPTRDDGLRESLLEAATDCVQEYIQQTGRFAPNPPPVAPATQAAALPTVAIDTHQIAAALEALARRGGR